MCYKTRLFNFHFKARENRPGDEVVWRWLPHRLSKRQSTVNNNSPIQDCVHPDDHTQSTYEITGDSWVQTFLSN